MLKLIAIGAALLGMHGAPHHRYWWMATSSCTISTGTYRNTNTFRAQPYINCTTVAAHWSLTPQTINPADAVDPCGYQDVICKP